MPELNSTARLAAIDMGSNAIRLRIVETGPAGRHLLDEQRLNVRLGLATYGQGQLDDTTIDSAMSALRECRDLCVVHRAGRYRAVATAALRDAPNRAALVDRVRAELGLDIEVIPGEEEARLLYLGLSAAHRARGPVAMIELGSGSLQVAAGSGETALFLSCLPLGALRLALAHGARSAMTEAGFGAMQQAIREGLAATCDSLRELGVRRLLGAGGGFRAVALLAGDRGAVASRLRAPQFEPLCVSLEQARGLATWLAALDGPQRESLGLPADRADSVTPAASLAAELMTFGGVDTLELVDTNVRDGLLADLAADATRGASLPL